LLKLTKVNGIKQHQSELVCWHRHILAEKEITRLHQRIDNKKVALSHISLIVHILSRKEVKEVIFYIYMYSLWLPLGLQGF